MIREMVEGRTVSRDGSIWLNWMQIGPTRQVEKFLTQLARQQLQLILNSRIHTFPDKRSLCLQNSSDLQSHRTNRSFSEGTRFEQFEQQWVRIARWWTYHSKESPTTDYHYLYKFPYIRCDSRQNTLLFIFWDIISISGTLMFPPSPFNTIFDADDC